jgi:hypothetical protein
MRDYLTPGDSVRVAGRPSSRPQPSLILLAAVLTLLLSAGTCAAAILVPAPAAMVPLLVVICIGAPMFASWELPSAVARLRADRARTNAVRSLMKALAALPETDHPLGL